MKTLYTMNDLSKKRWRTSKGHHYEEQAAAYLGQKGYRIIKRNYRHGHLEIDLIATKELEKLLVFVEVKFRVYSPHYNVYTAITQKKRNYVSRASQAFLQAHPQWQSYYGRYDVIFVIREGDEERLEHFEGAYRL